MENWFRCSVKSLTVLAVTLFLLQSTTAKKIKTSSDVSEETCEVCVKYLRKFIESLDDETLASTTKIEDAFRKTCKTSKKDDNRFCYYVGGLEESAVGILGEMSKPISWRAPVEKVCHKLFTNDNQICDLKYEKQINLAEVNLKKLKVKDLKAILSDWDESCRGCTEKQDYVKLIEDLMPKYAPESHAKRQAKKEL